MGWTFDASTGPSMLRQTLRQAQGPLSNRSPFDKLRDRGDISLQMGAHNSRGGQERRHKGRRCEFCAIFVIG